MYLPPLPQNFSQSPVTVTSAGYNAPVTGPQILGYGQQPLLTTPHPSKRHFCMFCLPSDQTSVPPAQLGGYGQGVQPPVIQVQPPPASTPVPTNQLTYRLEHVPFLRMLSEPVSWHPMTITSSSPPLPILSQQNLPLPPTSHATRPMFSGMPQTSIQPPIATPYTEFEEVLSLQTMAMSQV